MKGKRKIWLLAVAFMVIGFAAVATTLYINGTTYIGGDQEEFDVYYSKTLVDGDEDNSIIVDDSHISFTKTFKTVGETYTIDYYITNGSRNYDGIVTMTCSAGNDYIDVSNSWVSPTTLAATKTLSGTLTLEMIKSYAGEEDLELPVDCEITVAASERDSLGADTPAAKVEHEVTP